MMTDRLDHLVEHLANEPTDRLLAGIEAEIVRAIAARRAQARQAAALAPVGAASISLALAIGLAAGSATASATTGHRGDAFSVASSLAPSTLLDE